MVGAPACLRSDAFLVKISGSNSSGKSVLSFKSKGLAVSSLGLVLLLGASLVAAKSPQQPQNPAPQPQQPQNNPQPQNPQQQNGAGNTQNQNGNQNNQSGNQNNNQNKNVQNTPQQNRTALEAAKAQLAKIQAQIQAPPVITLRNIVVPPALVGDTITFTVNAYDRKSTGSTTFQFALSGNPPGSYVDPITGIFTWTPLVPGQYSFYVWVADMADYTRQANEQINIVVTPALQPFGYAIFAKARSVIDTRMFLIKSGLLQGVGSITGGQFGNGIPLTPGVPPQVGSANTSNPFSPIGSNSAFSPGPSSYLFGTGMNNQGAGLAALQQMMQGGGQGQSGMNGMVPGQMGQGQATGQGGGSLSSPFSVYQPPISPFGSVGNIMPQQNGTGSSFFQSGSGTGNMAQQMMMQQALQGGLGGLAGGLGGGLQSSMGQGGLGSMMGQGGLGGQGMGQGMNGMQGMQGSGMQGMQGNQGFQPGMNFPTPSYGGLGGSGGGFQNGQIPFGSTGPTGMSIIPSGPFANLQALVSTPQPNGLPSGQAGLIANALQYLVGPTEEWGMNVYMPYPERYQLGPGDMLSAQISSDVVPVTFDDLTVDQQGRIMLPGDDEQMVVRGLTVAQAQDHLQQRVRHLIKNGKLLLSLKVLRSMSIQILGDAYQPGNYQVPAVATLFNTLIVCGGPDSVGSLRNIQLRRNNGTTRTFDLYRYLTEGDMSADVPLQPGDVIFIPTVSARVNIKGEVERPAIYETLPGDTLPQLIKYAGGLTAAGYTQRAELDTETAGYGHVVKDVDLLASNTPAKFYDNDTISVYTVPTDLLDDLNLKGAVREQGVYEFHKGVTVADLIRKGGGLLPDAYTARADLNRRNPDKTLTLIPVNLEKALALDPSANIALAPHDIITVYTNEDVKWVGDRTVTITGSVQRPGTYQRNDGERVLDLLLQAGGITGQAYKDVAILQQAKPDGTPGPLVNLDLNRLAVDPNMNVVLNDHDTLTVQSNLEAHYVPEQTISVLGAVQQPGGYTHGENMRLKDAIQEAGGLMPNAGRYIEIQHARVPEGTPATKVSISDLTAGDPNANLALDAGDLITIPEDALIHMHPRKVIVLGRIAHPGAYPLADNETISQALAEAGGLLPDAFKRGAQLYRDPSALKTDSQGALAPSIVQMLQIVDTDQYNREMASADVEKVHLMQGGTQTNSVPLLGSGGTASQTNSTSQAPLSIWNEPLVTAARDITNEIAPSGNVGINLDEALNHKGSRGDIELDDQDIIVVPRTPSTVTVVGAVAIPSGILYTPGKTVRYYLNRAGGFTDDAAKDRLILIHPGGLVQRANLNSPMELGDQLLVPSKVMRAKLNDKSEEIDDISKQITAGIAVLAILKLLL